MRARRFDQALLLRAWKVLWTPTMQREHHKYFQFQWKTFREQLGEVAQLSHVRRRAASAILYIFACWSAANPGVPLAPIVLGTPEEEAPALLERLQAAPRQPKQSTKFLWKLRLSPPPSDSPDLAVVVWAEELAAAEARTIQRLQNTKTE